MSTASATHASVPSGGSGAPAQPLSFASKHFLLRRLHSLTGIVFGLYLCVHLLVNATLMEGARHDGGLTVFQQQVDQIHRLPFLGIVEWVAIYIPILFHTIYGIYIVVTGQPNLSNYQYGKNAAYVFQRVSAIILVVFMLFHVLSMKGIFGATSWFTFDPQDATTSTVRHFDRSFFITWIFYPIGILAACFHLANGFWTAAITWGLTVSRASQKRWGAVCAGVFIATFSCGMAALVAAGVKTAPGPSNAPVPAAHPQP